MEEDTDTQPGRFFVVEVVGRSGPFGGELVDPRDLVPPELANRLRVSGFVAFVIKTPKGELAQFISTSGALLSLTLCEEADVEAINRAGARLSPPPWQTAAHGYEHQVDEDGPKDEGFVGGFNPNPNGPPNVGAICEQIVGHKLKTCGELEAEALGEE